MGVSSNAPLCSCNAQGEKDLSAVLVLHRRPLLARTHGAAAPALRHSHRLNREMDEGGGEFQQIPISQSSTAEHNEMCRKAPQLLEEGKCGGGGKGRERERGKRRERAENEKQA